MKIIKPGMDTRQVIARFEAERQALAMMDHPNIAKVSGCRDAPKRGRPYFVMELVKGVPITKYLRRTTTVTRGATGAVHSSLSGRPARPSERDHPPRLKPSNVLVAIYDDRPVPKVIDFGVAKATNQTADRQDDVHAVWPGGRHAGIHEPGAGRAEPAGCRYTQRHLFTGCDALRIAYRCHAV